VSLVSWYAKPMRTWLCFVATLIPISCGGKAGEVTAGTRDGSSSSSPDAAMDASSGGNDSGPAADGGTEEPSAEGGVGTPCTSPRECAQGICLGPPFDGGYCSQQIGECPAAGGQGPCPVGSVCANGLSVNANGQETSGDYCLESCQSQATCRSGYSCCPDGRGMMVCVPPSFCGM
jgi:hypothetical protein